MKQILLETLHNQQPIMSSGKKCSEKNQHSGGTEMDFKLHVGAVIASMNGTMKMFKKGEAEDDRQVL